MFLLCASYLFDVSVMFLLCASYLFDVSVICFCCVQVTCLMCLLYDSVVCKLPV